MLGAHQPGVSWSHKIIVFIFIFIFSALLDEELVFDNILIQYRLEAKIIDALALLSISE